MASVIVSACAQPAPELPSPSSAEITAAPTATPSPMLTSVAAMVPLDASLLDLLPDSVDGIIVRPDPETAAEIARDPALARDATGIAVALVIAPSEVDTEIAVANIVELRPGTFDDAFFTAWRDTYDDGACAPAGGVSGRAVAGIEGHLTHIATCEGGARTYHAHLPGPDVLVSITALGERRLGEKLIAALEPGG